MKRGFIGVGAAIAIVVLAFLVFVCVSLYSYANTLRNQSVGYETQLTAQYLANQAYLSAYVGGFYEQVGIANLKSEKMDKILTDAVKGRYEKSGGFSPNGALFSAIKEAYPDLGGLNIFDKMMDYISSKREGYRADQQKLLDMLRSYDKWREEGILQSWIIKSILNVPSERLEARIGESVLKGQSARDKMYQIVLTEGITESYQKGTMKALSVKDVK